MANWSHHSRRLHGSEESGTLALRLAFSLLLEEWMLSWVMVADSEDSGRRGEQRQQNPGAKMRGKDGKIERGRGNYLCLAQQGPRWELNIDSPWRRARFGRQHYRQHGTLRLGVILDDIAPRAT